jgi:cytoskeleton protein RodZ
MSAEVVRDESPPPETAGALLYRAREAAGLTIDAVAQQLKLAPRQVRALEQDDYTHLPGRTFVRGFVRNYARVLHLDPKTVLDALPAGAAEPALEAPELQQTAPTMGELPITDHSRPTWTRWAIPLTLAAIVAAAAVYEWLRPIGEPPAAARKDAPAAVEQPAPPVKQERSGTSLPNPLAAPTATSAVAVSTPFPAPVTNANVPVASAAPSTGAAATAAEQSLVIEFRDYSWTEVRDRGGRVLLSKMNPGGTMQTLSGAPPLEIVIGNAADVSISYKGQPVDLVPYTRQNVARLTLP